MIEAIEVYCGETTDDSPDGWHMRLIHINPVYVIKTIPNENIKKVIKTNKELALLNLEQTTFIDLFQEEQNKITIVLTNEIKNELLGINIKKIRKVLLG